MGEVRVVPFCKINVFGLPGIVGVSVRVVPDFPQTLPPTVLMGQYRSFASLLKGSMKQSPEHWPGMLVVLVVSDEVNSVLALYGVWQNGAERFVLAQDEYTYDSVVQSVTSRLKSELCLSHNMLQSLSGMLHVGEEMG